LYYEYIGGYLAPVYDSVTRQVIICDLNQDEENIMTDEDIARIRARTLNSLDPESLIIARKASDEIKNIVIEMIANDSSPKSVGAKIIGINMALVELSGALRKSVAPLPVQNANVSSLVN